MLRPERLRLHWPTVAGRMRTDPAPLLLMALVVALTAALTSALGPLTERTSDRALAHAVRQSGPQGAVVATFPRGDEVVGARVRDPRAAQRVRADVARTRKRLPRRVAGVTTAGTASVTSPSLQLLGAGPGRYLKLTYLESPGGPPRVSYVTGTAPGSSAGDDRTAVSVPEDAGPWPVEVAVSQATATALDLHAGDRLSTKDEQARPVAVRVSGVFRARDPGDAVWRTSSSLLDPGQGVSQGVPTTTATALVTSEALPDLRLAVAANALTERIAFTPRPGRLRWAESEALVRSVASLKASPGLASGGFAWDSALDTVLTDGRAQVAAARGQADVLLLGLLSGVLLVLWQAAELLVRRRAGSVVLSRERGATLPQIAAELFAEAAVFAVGGAAIGFACTWLFVGNAGAGWWLVVPVVAAAAAAVTGTVLASRSTDVRRAPANRSARRAAARSEGLRRLLLLASVAAVAALTYVALRQRGVIGTDGGRVDRTAVSAPTWWAVAGALLVLQAVPFVTGLLLDATRRTTGGVSFFVAARLRHTGVRALSLLVVAVTVAQLTFAVSLAATEQRGQAAGALLGVGGDARATFPPGPLAERAARTADSARGVRAAVAGRVEDDVRATSRQAAASVRLVAVDAAAYQRLLAGSALPDEPALARLDRPGGDRVPALLLGGTAGLRDGLTVRDAGGVSVPLRVIGNAPRVQGALGAVIVVDAAGYERAGADAAPNTVWAVGPGAAAALRAGLGGSGELTTYAQELDARRSAPLASGLVQLAVASAVLLLLLAVAGVVLAAAGQAGPRAESLGRLRSLGLRDGQLWRVLAGELAAPVLVATLTGLALGLGAVLAMFGPLSLERITGQVGTPDVAVPLWGLGGVLVLGVTVLVLTQVEWTRLRRVTLGELLRAGSSR